MHPCILTHTIPIRPRRPARPEIHTYKHRTNSTSSSTASTIASWSQSCIYLHLLHNDDVILMHRRSPRPPTPEHCERACMLAILCCEACYLHPHFVWQSEGRCVADALHHDIRLVLTHVVVDPDACAQRARNRCLAGVCLRGAREIFKGCRLKRFVPTARPQQTCTTISSLSTSLIFIMNE